MEVESLKQIHPFGQNRTLNVDKQFRKISSFNFVSPLKLTKLDMDRSQDLVIKPLIIFKKKTFYVNAHGVLFFFSFLIDLILIFF